MNKAVWERRVCRLQGDITDLSIEEKKEELKKKKKKKNETKLVEPVTYDFTDKLIPNTF